MTAAVPSLVPVMRTMDRAPRTNYLSETLAGLARARFWDARFWEARSIEIRPLYLVDSGGGSEEWYRLLTGLPEGAGLDLRVCSQPAGRKLTNNQNGLLALEIGLASGADYIMHLEDDLAVCADFGQAVGLWLREHAHPSIPFYTFHTPYRQVREAFGLGRTAWVYPARMFYGNQCWVMSRPMAESAVDYLRVHVPLWRSTQGFDMLLKAWLAARGDEGLLASVPCFVQHVGEDSSLGNRFHNNQSWPGVDWTYRGQGDTA